MHLQSRTKNYENCAIVCNTKCPVSEFKQSLAKEKLIHNYLNITIYLFTIFT